MLILFFILWIIFNGALTLEIVIFDFIVTFALFLFMCKFMDYSLSKDILFIKRIPVMIVYVVTLIWEIFKANMNMIKFIIVKQEYELKPVIFKLTTSLKSNAARMLLANAITLTPGTITIEVKGSELIVHAVDKSLVIDDDGSFVFERILRKFEQGGDK